MNLAITKLKTNIEVFNTFMNSKSNSVGILIVENVDEYNILKEYINIPDNYRPNMEITKDSHEGLYLLIMTTEEFMTKIGSEDFYTFYFIFGTTRNIILPSFIFDDVINVITAASTDNLKRLKVISNYLFYVKLKEGVPTQIKQTKVKFINRLPDLPENKHDLILELLINNYEGNFKVRSGNTTYKVKAKWIEDIVRNNMLSYDDYTMLPLDLKGTVYRYISHAANSITNKDIIKLNHRVSVYLLKNATPINDLVAAKTLLVYCKRELKPRNNEAYIKYVYKLYKELLKVNRTLSRYIKKEWL